MQLTHQMQNNFIEILVIEQMIKEKKYKNVMLVGTNGTFVSINKKETLNI